MPPFYELVLTSDGKWLLCRTADGSPVIARFENREDAQRALYLFERSEQQTKSLVDHDEAKKEFDRAWEQARPKKSSRPTSMSGYDHQLDD